MTDSGSSGTQSPADCGATAQEADTTWSCANAEPLQRTNAATAQEATAENRNRNARDMGIVGDW